MLLTNLGNRLRKGLAMAEVEGSAMEKTILNQSLTIERLFTELDEERKASETATEEALSMILRLQEEKAAVVMEARQYQRLAEEKMHHTEESLAILGEAVSHKDIEISSLKYQIQAYKHRLLRTIVGNPDFEQMEIFDYPNFSRSVLFGNRNIHGAIRRNVSMPAASLDQLCPELDVTDDGGYLLPRQQSIVRIEKYMARLDEDYEESHKQQLLAEEAQKLDMAMKERLQPSKRKEKVRSESIAATNGLRKVVSNDCSGVGEKCKSCSYYSAVNHRAFCGSPVSHLGTKLDDEGVSDMYFQVKDSENMLEDNSPETSTSGNTTQFESCWFLCESCKQELQEPLLDARDVIENSHPMPQGNISKTSVHTHIIKKLSTLKEGASPNYPLSAVDPEVATDSSRTEAEHLKTWILQLENDIKLMRQEHSDVGKGQLKLLEEIHDQVSTIQLDTKNTRAKKCRSQDDTSLELLKEAMVSFWL